MNCSCTWYIDHFNIHMYVLTTDWCRSSGGVPILWFFESILYNSRLVFSCWVRALSFGFPLHFGPGEWPWLLLPTTFAMTCSRGKTHSPRGPQLDRDIDIALVLMPSAYKQLAFRATLDYIYRQLSSTVWSADRGEGNYMCVWLRLDCLVWGMLHKLADPKFISSLWF